MVISLLTATQIHSSPMARTSVAHITAWATATTVSTRFPIAGGAVHPVIRPIPIFIIWFLLMAGWTLSVATIRLVIAPTALPRVPENVELARSVATIAPCLKWPMSTKAISHVCISTLQCAIWHASARTPADWVMLCLLLVTTNAWQHGPSTSCSSGIAMIPWAHSRRHATMPSTAYSATATPLLTILNWLNTSGATCRAMHGTAVPRQLPPPHWRHPLMVRRWMSAPTRATAWARPSMWAAATWPRR